MAVELEKEYAAKENLTLKERADRWLNQIRIVSYFFHIFNQYLYNLFSLLFSWEMFMIMILIKIILIMIIMNIAVISSIRN